MKTAVVGPESERGRARAEPINPLRSTPRWKLADLCSGPIMRISDVQHAGHGRARKGVVAVGSLRRDAAAAAGGAATCRRNVASAIAQPVAPTVAPLFMTHMVAQLVLAFVEVVVMRIGADGEVGSRACRGAPPWRLMHDRRALPRPYHRCLTLRLLLLLAHCVLMRARALRHCRRAVRVTAQWTDDARLCRSCAAPGTVCA